MKKRIVGIMLVLAMMLGSVGFVGCSLEEMADRLSGKLKTGDVVSFYDKDDKLISSFTMDMDGVITTDEETNKNIIKKSDDTVVEVPENTYTIKVAGVDGSTSTHTIGSDTTTENSGN